MSSVMEHVHQLADVIGPRPATTDAEANAADYIEDVFAARGLETERQEFDCPRTRSWALVAASALMILAAALSFWLPWVAFAIAVLVAVAFALDLDTRPGLMSLMPKGPSQNIIARHVPKARRGERLKKVVIVAHYDSAKSSLSFAPGLVRHYGKSVRVTTIAMLITPVVILIGALPFAAEWKPWTGVAALVAAGVLLAPLVVNVHRELFMQATDGANDNASGVAAMLGVMEATVPEPSEHAVRERSRRRGPEAALEADVVPEDAILEYRDLDDAPLRESDEGHVREHDPIGSFGDVGWETSPMPPVGGAPAAAGPVVPAVVPEPLFEDEPRPTRTARAAVPRPSGGTTLGEMYGSGLTLEVPDTDVSPWDEDDVRAAAPAPVAPLWDEELPTVSRIDEGESAGQERLDLGAESALEDDAPRGAEGAHGIREWLGVGRGFDVRKAGKKIGNWSNIDADDEDEFGFKAGTAGELEFDAPGFAGEEASRIRRRVTESVDRALSEKEIWFVATGSREAGSWGMRALLDAYGSELRDALIINIDSVGAGTVAYVTSEGMLRRYPSDRRLISQAKRTAREKGLSVKGHACASHTTDATVALARRFKAMSVMAFDINSRVPNWHWKTDTADTVQERTVNAAVEFVTALVRDL